ncbi:hypothetical protein AAHA92_14896 [Salvia divinorum]|uniref:Uncharacterized protein n=1 Tax=Salvia divinorum TaxID=28513 RepID=A0ABD1HD09_SALDI
MMRFLGKTTASAARSAGSSTTEVCGVGDEVLSAWELVNESQSDDEDLYSYDSEEANSTADSVSDDDLEPVPAEDDDDEKDVDVDEDAPAPRDFVSASDVIAIQEMSVSPPMTLPVAVTLNYVARDYAEDYCDDGSVKDAEGGDDDDDVEDYDFDDELVPWKLKGRFGKQRISKMGIRKMGQRGGPKLTAKKLPYYVNRPGFAHGKLR